MSTWSNGMWLARGDEPIWYRGPLSQLLMSKRAAQLFGHIMKPVKNDRKCSYFTRSCFSCEKIVHVSNASRAARNSFAGRMFVTSALDNRQSEWLLFFICFFLLMYLHKIVRQKFWTPHDVGLHFEKQTSAIGLGLALAFRIRVLC